VKKIKDLWKYFLFSAYISAPFQRASAGKTSVVIGKINRKGRRGRKEE
jgi:hypothetical protein